MTTAFDAIIIGAGQGGPPLARWLAVAHGADSPDRLGAGPDAARRSAAAVGCRRRQVASARKISPKVWRACDRFAIIASSPRLRP